MMCDLRALLIFLSLLLSSEGVAQESDPPLDCANPWYVPHHFRRCLQDTEDMSKQDQIIECMPPIGCWPLLDPWMIDPSLWSLDK
jgi:hypothetical protein